MSSFVQATLCSLSEWHQHPSFAYIKLEWLFIIKVLFSRHAQHSFIVVQTKKTVKLAGCPEGIFGHGAHGSFCLQHFVDGPGLTRASYLTCPEGLGIFTADVCKQGRCLCMHAHTHTCFFSPEVCSWYIRLQLR